MKDVKSTELTVANNGTIIIDSDDVYAKGAQLRVDGFVSAAGIGTPNTILNNVTMFNDNYNDEALKISIKRIKF